MSMSQTEPAVPQRPLSALAVVLLLGPFYLNDFANLYVTDWRTWLGIDYFGVKLMPILVAIWLIRSHSWQASDFGLKVQSLPALLATFLVVALLGTFIDQNGYTLIARLPSYAALGEMPEITNPAWNWIDLTAGLLMVGICEELVFRGFLRAFISRYTRNPFALVALSSVAFGLIHWSLGLHTVLITTAIGAVFMAAYLRTGALPAIMLAHFAINFIDFSGVIPTSIFKVI